MFAAFCSHASTNSTALAYGHFVLNLQHNIQGAPTLQILSLYS